MQGLGWAGERGGEGVSLAHTSRAGRGGGAERVRGGPSPPPPELALGCGHIPPVHIRARRMHSSLSHASCDSRAPRMASELNVRVPRCS